MNILTDSDIVKCSGECYLGFMDIIAHRGLSGIYPENTMLAFSKAVEAGADGIELDVHLSSDGEVIIIHDESLKRTAGIDRPVSSMTRSELERTNAGKTRDGSFGLTPIPSLEEYLSFIKDTGLYTNIELKTAPVYYPGIEEKTLALVRHFSLEDRIIFSSFNWLSVLYMKRLAPEIPAGLLISQPRIANIGREMRDAGIECYHPDYPILSDEAVAELHDNGIRINVWTVDGEDGMRQCQSWGIEGLITNRADKAVSLLRSKV